MRGNPLSHMSWAALVVAVMMALFAPLGSAGRQGDAPFLDVGTQRSPFLGAHLHTYTDRVSALLRDKFGGALERHGPTAGGGAGELALPTCKAYVARLQERYAGAAPFNGSQPLETYLSSGNGVVLSALDGESQGESSFYSMSWLARLTSSGFNPLPLPLGVIFDPMSRFKVECVFPSDGATLGRDAVGCGPQRIDPDFGSAGAAHLDAGKRAQMRADYAKWVAGHFGVNATWRDVPCSKVPNFPPPGGGSWSALGVGRGDCPAVRASEVQRVQSFWSTSSDMLAPIFGHPMCSDDAPALSWLVYDGPCSWPPADFGDMLAVQRLLAKAAASKGMYHWNELVVSKFADDKELWRKVEAVYWYDFPGLPAVMRAKLKAQAYYIATKLTMGLGRLVHAVRGDPSAPDAPFSCS